jgi:hypothetical protein
VTEEDRFSEYRPVGLSEPLRQGDVLEKVSDDATAWDRHLLVITADCDFAYDKHQGRVTCVPLLTKDEYLIEFFLPKVREQAVTKLTSGLREIFLQAGAPNVSESRMRTWPTEQSNEEILSVMSVSESRRQLATQMLDGIRLLQRVPNSMAQAVDALVTALGSIPNGQAETKIRADISNRIQNTFRQPPGDALFLSTIAERYDDGYFAYLRHLEQNLAARHIHRPDPVTDKISPIISY